MKWLIIVAGLFLAGCSTTLKVPGSSESEGITDEQAVQAYSRVLQKYVNTKGEVDFEGIQKDKGDLYSYVAYVARKKLDSFSDQQERLAHLINSYNALSMYVVLEKGIPKTNSGLNKVFFFVFTKVTVGGEVVSLKAYEDNYIRSLGESRIHWALNCMAVSCPRLPQTPFTGKNLESELQAGAVEFMNSPANVIVNHDKKMIEVTEIFDFFPGDFEKYGTLNQYVNRYRTEKVPEDYKVSFIPYDWTINNSNRH